MDVYEDDLLFMSFKTFLDIYIQHSFLTLLTSHGVNYKEYTSTY